MTEYSVRLDDGMEPCSVITRETGEHLELQVGESVRGRGCGYRSSGAKRWDILATCGATHCRRRFQRFRGLPTPSTLVPLARESVLASPKRPALLPLSLILFFYRQDIILNRKKYIHGLRIKMGSFAFLSVFFHIKKKPQSPETVL
jgi:hypothetical protein